MKIIHVLIFMAAALALHAQQTEFTDKECPGIKSTLPLPKGWFFLEIKNPDSPDAAYVVAKEKVESEYDSFKTGLNVSAIKGVPAQTDMKPSEYAQTLMSEGQEKDETTKVETTDEPPFKVFKSTSVIDAEEGKITVITLLKANDTTGTLYRLTWQYPEAEEGQAMQIWNEMLKRMKIDPTF